MSFAIVFSGQGMQHPQMLPWLVEDDIVRSTCALLGVDDWRGPLSNKAWASTNSNAQVLLVGLELAAWQQIAPGLPDPVCVAGYSVGELAAFSAAGVFDAPCALDLARQRAAAMDECASRAPGGLLAVTGVSEETVDALCAKTGLEVAIRIGIDSVVLGGTNAMLGEGERRLESHGARGTRLSVGVASHTYWMQQAAEEFAKVLIRTRLQRPETLLFSNLNGRVQHAAQAGSALAKQIASTVRWDECMDDIYARAPSCVLEIGPGQALARMWNQRHPDIPARSCDDFRSQRALNNWITRIWS